MLKRIIIVAGMALALLGFHLSDGAYALPTGYTDGTETYPYICNEDKTVCTNEDGTGFGPIPYGPVWVEECKVVEFDPTYVMVTLHFDYDGNGTEDAYDVIPYEYNAPTMVIENVEAFVAGKNGTVWLTWNLGSGETDRVPFNCAPDEPTTTTTPTTGVPWVCPNPPAQVPDGVCPSTTTTTTVIGTPSSLKQDPTEPTLPVTGSTTVPLAVLGVALVAVGAAVARKAGQ